MVPPDMVKVILPAIAAFAVGIAITPIVTHFLYKYKVWKKKGGKQALDGSTASVFNDLHAENETKTPRMGGIVIWGSVAITVMGLALIAKVVPKASIIKLDFLSRDQTWIPFMTLFIGALVGFMNDVLDVWGSGKGLSLTRRLLFIIIMSAFIGWWFYEKLGVDAIGIPFGTPLTVGPLIIPLFIVTSLVLYASGVIDGIDGLSGGVFASIFASYALIAYSQSQINIAAFAATLVGGILAFLWFNIPPARFYMTETGTMGLTLTIAVLAFMTDVKGDGVGIFALPIIGALLFVTVASNVIQVLSKRFRGKKVFRIAPLHHHFEALGWPGYKVTMRYWILSVMCAFAGVIFAIVAS